MFASLAIAGFPFLSGFYSKDIIIELSGLKFLLTTSFLYWISTITALITCFYSVRSVVVVFLKSTNTPRVVFLSAHEGVYGMLIPLLVLMVGSLITGYMFFNFFTVNSYAPHINLENYGSVVFAEFLPLHVKNTPLYSVLIVMFLTVYVFTAKYEQLIFAKLVNYSFFCAQYNNFYSNTVLNFSFQKLFHACYGSVFLNLDKGVFELFGPLGVFRGVDAVSRYFRDSQSGMIRHFLSITLTSILCFFSLVMVWNLVT